LVLMLSLLYGNKIMVQLGDCVSFNKWSSIKQEILLRMLRML
jgi:hypothetical protein